MLFYISIESVDLKFCADFAFTTCSFGQLRVCWLLLSAWHVMRAAGKVVVG